MIEELRDLYQEVILDHSKRPRNFRRLDRPSCQANGHNPLCGDRLTVFLSIDGDRIADATFEGAGCAISRSPIGRPWTDSGVARMRSTGCSGVPRRSSAGSMRRAPDSIHRGRQLWCAVPARSEAGPLAEKEKVAKTLA